MKKENEILKLEKINNHYLTILIILCSSLIILTNYLISKNLEKNIQKQIMKVEYNKIWWEDNYELIKELQKNQINGYINILREQKPELIEEIEKKLDAEKNNRKYLTNYEIEELKKDTPIKWNTWATISLIWFSDLECEHCIEESNLNISEKLIEEFWTEINYSFKNFPLPTYKNSMNEAIATICIKHLSDNDENYFKFIKQIYSNSIWGWEWIELSKLTDLATKLGINKTEFNKCLNNKTYKEEVEKEFQQGRYLKIDSVPSKIILNNETWEYILIQWFVEIDTIIEKIKELKH